MANTLFESDCQYFSQKKYKCLRGSAVGTPPDKSVEMVGFEPMT